jgi:hypothetical protein
VSNGGIWSTEGKDIKEKKKRNEEGEFNTSNKGISFKTELVLSRNVNEGEGNNGIDKEKISSPKEKNINVGEWDNIKEKMTWQAVEKRADVASDFNSGVSINHVEALFTTVKPDKGME